MANGDVRLELNLNAGLKGSCGLYPSFSYSQLLAAEADKGNYVEQHVTYTQKYVSYRIVYHVTLYTHNSHIMFL